MHERDSHRWHVDLSMPPVMVDHDCDAHRGDGAEQRGAEQRRPTARAIALTPRPVELPGLLLLYIGTDTIYSHCY